MCSRRKTREKKYLDGEIKKTDEKYHDEKMTEK